MASLTTWNDPLTNRFMATAVIFTNKITSVAVPRIPNGLFCVALIFSPPPGFLNVLIFWMGGLAGSQSMVSAYLHQSSDSPHKTFRPQPETWINKYAYMNMEAFITALRFVSFTCSCTIDVAVQQGTLWYKPLQENFYTDSSECQLGVLKVKKK